MASSSAKECGYVAGLGDACAVPGGYEVVLANGARVFTHGGDLAPSSDDVTAQALAPLRDPPCVADPLNEYHAQFIYAHPIDKPNRGAQLAPQLRGLIAEANGLLHLEGSEFGRPVEYRFRCAEDGRPLVSIATIPLMTGQGDYTKLVNALLALGYTNGNAKYWVWYDDPTACACGGIAAAPLNAGRTPLNAANGGQMFGATYGYMSARILMHENGHNLGAVNGQAPDTSGAGHCNDGRDIMCYNDGGSNSSGYSDRVCTDRQHFDCDHDTYFHTKPPAGSFLARFWNLGAPIVRFVQGCAYLEDLVLAPGLTASVDVPAACAGHAYAIYGRAALAPTQHAVGQFPLGLTVNVFSVCWYAGETLLSCPENAKAWGHEGTVPAGADRAVVTWEKGENGRFTLSVI